MKASAQERTNDPPAAIATNPSSYPLALEPDIALLHETARRLAMDSPLEEVLAEVVEGAVSVVKTDSCFIYTVEGEQLVLRASKNPHPEVLNRLKLKLGAGITGWVAEQRQPVAIAQRAFEDRRFQMFNELPEDRFEAFLSVPILNRKRVVGVINLQNRDPHRYSEREKNLISTLGFLAGAEVERARLENENQALSSRLEARKVLERAKGILQDEMKIHEEDAYLILQRQSQQRRRPMKEIAEAIILSRAIKQSSI